MAGKFERKKGKSPRTKNKKEQQTRADAGCLWRVS